MNLDIRYLRTFTPANPMFNGVGNLINLFESLVDNQSILIAA